MTAVGIGLVAIFFVVALVNWYIIVRNYIWRDRYVSMLPLIGGLAGVTGFLLIPWLRFYAWAPLLLDPGTTLALFMGVPVILIEVWQTSRFNFVGEYRARDCLRP